MSGRYEHHPKQYAVQRSGFDKATVEKLTTAFFEKNALLGSMFEELSPKEFCRDVFPEGSFEKAGYRDDGQVRRPNGVMTVIGDKTKNGRSYNWMLFDELYELDDVLGKEFVIMSPVGYSGRRRLAKNAYSIYGFAIDLDYVEVGNVKDLVYQMQNKILPFASHIVNSGTGLHIYYVFDTPVPAYKKYIPGLTKLKAGLADMIWNQYTSISKDKQVQGIFQGYRIPGTQTKISKDCLVTAFRCGKPVSLAYLNSFVDDDHMADFDDLHYVPISEARDVWPDWYQRRIVEGKPVGDYSLTEGQKKRREAWYETWICRVLGSTRKGKKYPCGAYDGNRYFCMCVLFHYAMKAGIPLEKAESDALSLVPRLNLLTENPKNQFTDEDVRAAELYYNRKYIRMGRDVIKRLTGIDIGETKRSPIGKRVSRRKDKSGNSNLKARAWGVRDALYPDGSWRNTNGRPKGSGTKEALVQSYFIENPNSKPADAARELGISRTTVYKYMKNRT